MNQNIKKKTKRRPYVRSEFFKKDKIFLEAYWQHLHQKAWKDRYRRVRFFPCGLELVQNTRVSPVSKENPFDRSQILHRFTGITPEKELFRVQIKEEKDTKNKWLMSIFPTNDI